MASQAKSVFDLVEESIKTADNSSADTLSPRRVIDVTLMDDILNGVNGSLKHAATLDELWAPLFQRVALFVKIVDTLADVRNLKLSYSAYRHSKCS
jgi:hypothetical protein